MTTHLIMDSGRRAFAEALAASLPRTGLEQYRLDRLLELRAVIDSLRAEQTHDPVRALISRLGE